MINIIMLIERRKKLLFPLLELNCASFKHFLATLYQVVLARYLYQNVTAFLM